MRNSSRRVAFIGISVAVAVGVTTLTGACGARPTATVGDMAVAAPTPTIATAPAQTSPSQTTPPAATPSSPPATSPEVGPRLDPQPLLAAAQGIEPNTTLGAVVFDRVTGRELLAMDPDRQFRSASLVKVLIAIDALRSGGANPMERQRIANMLSTSDDGIASSLWVKYGPDIVPRMAATLGLQHTEAPEVAGKWGEVKVTARDMVRVYQYVMDNLLPEDHKLIVDALARASEVAADGFNQFFGIPHGLNTQWAIKQGWGNNSTAMVLHSTGLVGGGYRYVVILLTEHPLGSGWRRAAESVTAAAGALTGLLPDA
ncbi:hypothetical protein [Actinophytocola sp.]|uniref:hypothetical protein n=1 Tax=Actinophytocola sp. TaxID=1872138 RepID=UPI002ED2CC7D